MNAIDPKHVTTALELPGYRIVQNCGLVRGIVVRSRSIFGNIGAAIQTLFGGNALISVRYDANEIPPKRDWVHDRR